jgi:hypothetical protein
LIAIDKASRSETAETDVRLDKKVVAERLDPQPTNSSSKQVGVNPCHTRDHVAIGKMVRLTLMR